MHVPLVASGHEVVNEFKYSETIKQLRLCRIILITKELRSFQFVKSNSFRINNITAFSLEIYTSVVSLKHKPIYIIQDRNI